MAIRRAGAKIPAARTSGKAVGLPRASADAAPRGDNVVSLRRSLDILRAFGVDDGSLTRHDIAKRTGLPNTTVARLVHTLLALGYLSRIGPHSRYRPGPSVLAIGHALLEALPYRRIARPLMQRFATEFDVWVTLGTVQGDHMLVLEHATSLPAPDIPVRVGSLLPMASTALGRAHLWAQTAGRRAESPAKVEQKGRSSEPRLGKDLEVAFSELDRSGFCTAFDSRWRGALEIGTPIVMSQDGDVLALACGNLSRPANVRALAEKGGPALLRLASEIKSALLQSGSFEDL